MYVCIHLNYIMFEVLRFCVIIKMYYWLTTIFKWKKYKEYMNVKMLLMSKIQRIRLCSQGLIRNIIMELISVLKDKRRCGSCFATLGQCFKTILTVKTNHYNAFFTLLVYRNSYLTTFWSTSTLNVSNTKINDT